MEDKVLAFILQYLGVAKVGDTPANKGQCVGLVEMWSDFLQLPHTWGNAKDLLANADPKSFEIVNNDPNDLNQFPPTGAIFVYGDGWGNGLGHTGVILTADGSSIILFEANDPNLPAIARHDYTGALGWLIPIIPVPPTATATTADPTPPVTTSTQPDVTSVIPTPNPVTETPPTITPPVEKTSTPIPQVPQTEPATIPPSNQAIQEPVIRLNWFQRLMRFLHL